VCVMCMFVWVLCVCLGESKCLNVYVCMGPWCVHVCMRCVYGVLCV